MTTRFAVIFSVMLVVGACSVVVWPQDPVKLDTNPPPMAAPRTAVKRSGTASAAYEKQRDLTFAVSAPIELKLPDSGRGWLTAGFTSKGNGASKPDYIILRLFTSAKDRAYVDKPEAIIAVDERKVFEGKATVTDARTNGNEVYTSFEIIVSVDDFLTFGKAERLAIALGPSGWIIPKTELSKFDDLRGIF